MSSPVETRPEPESASTQARALPATIQEALAFAKPFLNSARADGKTMSVAYVSASGQPAIALRGSTQVFSDHQLCLWLRDVTCGMGKALPTQPKIALLYRDQDTKTTLTFEGHARLVDDPAVRDRIFDLAPEPERIHTPKPKGAAVLIDIGRFKALIGKLPGVKSNQEVDIRLAPAEA